MREKLWVFAAIAFFIIASARFYTAGDMLGSAVFGMVALVFAFRMFIQRRRRKQAVN